MTGRLRCECAICALTEDEQARAMAIGRELARLRSPHKRRGFLELAAQVVAGFDGGRPTLLATASEPVRHQPARHQLH